MNPVLLKPTSDRKSQVVFMGKVLKDMDAVDYHEFKQELLPKIKEVYQELDQEYDAIILEGAGSPAEINLNERDIVNMGMARLVDAPVILVATKADKIPRGKWNKHESMIKKKLDFDKSDTFIIFSSVNKTGVEEAWESIFDFSFSE